MIAGLGWEGVAPFDLLKSRKWPSGTEHGRPHLWQTGESDIQSP